MKSVCFFMLLLYGAIPGSAQIVIEEMSPAAVVEVRDGESAKLGLRILNPVAGKVVRDTLLEVRGVLLNGSPGAVVRIELGKQEQFVTVDDGGVFSTCLPIEKRGAYQLAVAAGNVCEVIEILYQPQAESLQIVSDPNMSLTPGEDVQLEAVAKLVNGESIKVNPLASWNSSLPIVGRINSEGIFSAQQPGETTITATYEEQSTQLTLEVKSVEFPVSFKELSNLVVSSRKIVLKVIDYADVDGDIVSIFHNGKTVAEYVEISHQPRSFPLVLSPGMNRISLRADNEGQEGPNTASIWVVTEEGEFEQKFKVSQHALRHFSIISDE
jgi:hypothetical protein